MSQLVPVQPNTEYDFECYVKTERLDSAETGGGIANAADESWLVESARTQRQQQLATHQSVVQNRPEHGGCESEDDAEFLSG